MQENRPNSIEKALEILMAFAPYNQEMGTGEISRRLGLHKATASRILRTLVDKGFLQQDPESRKFTLGPAVSDLGRAYNSGLSSNLVLVAKPHIDRLRSDLAETAVLEVLSGESTVMAYVAEGPQRVRIAGTVGDRLPAHAAAGAKAILAFSPLAVVEKAIGEELLAFTPHTITTREEYVKELETVRRRGYSLDREEIDVGINAVGAPVFDRQGRAVAAVVVAGPAQRVSGDEGSEPVRKVKEVAAAISARLHHGGGVADGRRRDGGRCCGGA